MLENLYESCGILATFLGTLVEGEVLLLTSILSAKLGMFSYTWTLVAGFLGAYMQAWTKFIIAKKHGVKLLNKKPSLQAKLDKASVWFDKRPYTILSIYKLFYGMTTIIILMAGLRDMSYWRFGLHLAIAIGLWVAILGGFGYYCAEALIDNIKSLSDYKWHVIGSLGVIGLLVWYFKHRPQNKICLEPIE